MKIFKIILLIILTAVLGTAVFVYWLWRTGDLQKTVVQEITNKVTNQSDQSLLTEALGFSRTRTYLVLFLNNTELRPGGGFIGAYALMQVEKGVPHILKVEGTEILDNLGNRDFVSVPPAPLSKYLKVSRWFFRDSNWSPDFPISAQKSMELFLKQTNQTVVNRIDGVIGFTPTMIEEILKITGPIKVDGKTFTAENFTANLEYEVEYGYAKKGLDFASRKNILSDLASVLLQKLRFDIFKNWQRYYELSERMFREKQLVIYSDQLAEQQFLALKNWNGQMKKTDSDYLLWVDANLGALKTDVAIERELSYQFFKDKNGRILATAKMTFIHRGQFDWRTSRYRDYARIFVPLGSQFVSSTGAMEMEKSKALGKIDIGEENGRAWFGTFIAVEPGKIGELAFSYYLPPAIEESIKNGAYNLLVQKQIGTIAPKLTLGLNFDKKLVSAKPGEMSAKHGDNRYDPQTDLKEDREFRVLLSK